MKLISIQVGLPREVNWRGRSVTTGIFKEPIAGPVMLRILNLDGDAQADLTVHGGTTKAAYAYPVEHYDYWRHELPDMLVADRPAQPSTKEFAMKLNVLVAALAAISGIVAVTHAAYDAKWGGFVINPAFFTRLVYAGV